MKKLYPFLLAASLALIVLRQLFFTQISFYFVSVIIMLLAMLPLFISYERANHSAREITLTASLIALAVASRAVFYLVPQVKPIAAVVAVSGVCLGAKRGCVVGMMSMFVSNFIFGQGAWTPFQMFAMGLVGFVFGIVFRRIKRTRITLAITGFLSVFIFYGVVVDFLSVLYFNTDFNIKGILAVYASGIPYNFAFALTTAIVLFFFGEPFIKKIERINIKYGIVSE